MVSFINYVNLMIELFDFFVLSQIELKPWEPTLNFLLFLEEEVQRAGLERRFRVPRVLEVQQLPIGPRRKLG